MMRAYIISMTALIIAVSAVSSQGATIDWNGSVDSFYTNGANWVGGVVPRITDYQDKIAFQNSSLSGVMGKTSTLTGNRGINAIYFYDSGYTLNGNQMLTKYLTSAGSGTNTIESLKVNGSFTWNVDTGNTLVIDSLYQDGNGETLTFEGGGTLILNGDINAWGSLNYVNINDLLLIVRDIRVHSKTTSITKLMQASSELQLETTVSAAEALITANTIIEDSGNGFNVIDIGGGYVSIKTSLKKPEGTVIIIN